MYIYIFLTVAAVSNDPTNIPPQLSWKAFLFFCNRNSIIFCTCKGARYHWMLYLRITHTRDKLIIKLKIKLDYIKNYIIIRKYFLHSDKHVVVVIRNFLRNVAANWHVREMNKYKYHRCYEFLNVKFVWHNSKNLTYTLNPNIILK